MSYRQSLMRIDDRLGIADRLLEQAHHAVDSGAFGAAADFSMQAKFKLGHFLDERGALVFGRERAGVADADLMLDELGDIDDILTANGVRVGLTIAMVRRGEKEGKPTVQPHTTRIPPTPAWLTAREGLAT